jgi:hypothetical protein
VPDGMDMLKKAAIIAGILIIPMIFLFIQVVSFLTPFVLALCVWGGFKLYRLQSLEYEYIVTNGELDVDKIMGQVKRKRVLTVDSRSFEMFAPMTKDHEKDYTSQTINKTYDVAASKNSKDRWFAMFNGKDGVRTLLILEYDERVVKAMKPHIPRRAFSDR